MLLRDYRERFFCLVQQRSRRDAHLSSDFGASTAAASTERVSTLNMDNALAQLDALVGKSLELQSASPAPEESSNKAQDKASGGDITCEQHWHPAGLSCSPCLLSLRTAFKLFSTSKSEAAPLVHLELKEHKEEHGHVEDRRIRCAIFRDVSVVPAGD